MIKKKITALIFMIFCYIYGHIGIPFCRGVDIRRKGLEKKKKFITTQAKRYVASFETQPHIMLYNLIM